MRGSLNSHHLDTFKARLWGAEGSHSVTNTRAPESTESESNERSTGKTKISSGRKTSMNRVSWDCDTL